MKAKRLTCFKLKKKGGWKCNHDQTSLLCCKLFKTKNFRPQNIHDYGPWMHRLHSQLSIFIITITYNINLWANEASHLNASW